MIDLRTESRFMQPWNYGVRHFVVAWKGELRGRQVVWYERVFHVTMGIANFFFPLNYLIATIEKAIFDRQLPPEEIHLPLPNTHLVEVHKTPTPPPQDSPPSQHEGFEFEEVVND